jgi:small subunit ribosomal protein S18
MAYHKSRNEERGRDAGERGNRAGAPVRRQFFRRRKSCPFSGENAQKIDYKDVRTLSKFVSEGGKIIPSRISSVCTKKQRELAIAIKRSRFLALMPYVSG